MLSFCNYLFFPCRRQCWRGDFAWFYRWGFKRSVSWSWKVFAAIQNLEYHREVGMYFEISIQFSIKWKAVRKGLLNTIKNWTTLYPKRIMSKVLVTTAIIICCQTRNKLVLVDREEKLRMLSQQKDLEAILYSRFIWGNMCK